MPVFLGIAAGLSILGGISSIFAGRSAKKAAERQGEEEARLEGLVTDEKLRQLRKEETALAGSTVASAAGSGVKVGTGSPLSILAEQASEFAYERLITERVGASRTSLALAQGRSIGQRAQSQAYAQAIQGFSSAFSIIAASRRPTPP